MNDYNINRLEDGIERLEYDISIIILANLYTLGNGEKCHQNFLFTPEHSDIWRYKCIGD